MVCSFCKLNAAKYKCPACYILYCSVDCWKLHKKECVPVLRKNKEGCSDDLNKYKPNIYQYPTEDTVPYRKLQSLGERQEIKDLLCNPHLRHMLTAIDSTDNPTVAMQNAMLEPIFVEFADACLAVREEKQLEVALDAIIMRVIDLKNSIASMIFKLEHEYETLNWPQFLDNFALISGQLTALSKMLTHDKSPPLRNLTVLPLLLSQERDEDLVRLSEHRITTFAHDLVPNYLRTKPEPEVEHKMLQLEHKAASLSFETTQKQMAAYSKVVSHVWDIVSKAREEWETEGGTRGGAAQTSSVADTHALVAAIAMGKGLKVMVPQGVQPSVPQGMMVAPVGPPGGGPMNPNQQQQMGPMTKAPSAIKTNIKAATQIHPYSR